MKVWWKNGMGVQAVCTGGRLQARGGDSSHPVARRAANAARVVTEAKRARVVVVIVHP